MRKLAVVFATLILPFLSLGQGNSFHSQTLPTSNKGKPVVYNAFGMGVYPNDQLMVGGNHISYRKFGFGVSWRVGINNILILRDGLSFTNYDTAVKNNWQTGNTKKAYSFGVGLNMVVPITKKIPLYFGIGTVRERIFSELQTPYKNPGETEWVINTDETKFKLNFGGGVFIPLTNRIILNLGYDHLPQTFFVGIGISGPFNYEDIDMW
ncbi:MAG: outer membrane beta-barrel protein [Bacteroidia bacterium]|nr:outer membrane beta-barrel protein [Bacteroidia bacterium]MCF8427726.1 outer membrane beta-barrel protein [Bacteroidia bacterium]MCF8446366.1 outer membrane beta-barrel protein [Bacteroidia bacterium]